TPADPAFHRIHISRSLLRPPPPSTLFPYTTLFRSRTLRLRSGGATRPQHRHAPSALREPRPRPHGLALISRDSAGRPANLRWLRSEEHTSELQSREKLVCRLLLEKKNHMNNLNEPR